MKETIIQFGTGNFLRAFADAFVDELNKQGLYEGKIVIVSPTDSKNIETINSQKGRYNLLIRGIENGKRVNTKNEINSISRGINPYRDFESFHALADDESFRFIISNTTEAGIAFDENCLFDDKPASSFSAKLTQLLYRRYKARLKGFAIFACELIDNNAKELKECVLKYAKLWELEEEFSLWIENENDFCNTLVDRIVTGFPKDNEICPDDKLLDVAEPYHFWAIEGDYEAELSFKKAGLNVIWCEDIYFYKKRKVRVLNGAHTAMVFPALLCNIHTVGECLKDEQIKAFLNKCLFDIILPVLGETDENITFAKAVSERFENPYISHRLKSIALNSISKFSVRILPTMLEYKEKFGFYPKELILSLVCLIKYYKENEVSGENGYADFIKNNSAEAILKNKALWGRDLSDLLPLINECSEFSDTRKAIQWSLS